MAVSDIALYRGNDTTHHIYWIDIFSSLVSLALDPIIQVRETAIHIVGAFDVLFPFMNVIVQKGLLGQ